MLDDRRGELLAGRPRRSRRTRHAEFAEFADRLRDALMAPTVGISAFADTTGADLLT
ncbi:hypothetical protein [Dactylosporangium sp. NPDC051484]|uniref:hypothetical protein n=1 Tax=Dactylosporangium sp. NPDC051484 TaxID=3154942 RepID=UPI00344F53F7